MLSFPLLYGIKGKAQRELERLDFPVTRTHRLRFNFTLSSAMVGLCPDTVDYTHDGVNGLFTSARPKGRLLKNIEERFHSADLLYRFLASWLIGLLADAIFKKGDSEKKHHEISLIRICEYLTEAEKWRERNFRILTHIDFGAEILYRTQHEVIGTPYHRNSPGILDTYDIMTADTDQEALNLIRKRNIDLILLCPQSTESIFYSKPEQISTFYKRLLDDMIPNWLRKVELTSDLSSSFLLFETIEESNSHI